MLLSFFLSLCLSLHLSLILWLRLFLVYYSYVNVYCKAPGDDDVVGGGLDRVPRPLPAVRPSPARARRMPPAGREQDRAVRAAAGCGVLARALDRHSSKFVQNLVLNAAKEQVCIIGCTFLRRRTPWTNYLSAWIIVAERSEDKIVYSRARINYLLYIRRLYMLPKEIVTRVNS